jgi:predicted Fe-Mo cluster-binding NifX family protein
MRAAFATWNERIAPVFDTAARVTVVDADSGREINRTEEALPAGLAVQKVGWLTELRVKTLVCGAISWPLQVMVAAAGIRLVPFVAGPLNEVIEAWLAGTVAREALAMPGCRDGRHAGPRGGPPRGGPGLSRRRAGGPGGGLGRFGWTLPASGRPPIAVCPACGHQQACGPGGSRTQNRCPVCGTRLLRDN